MSTDISLNSPPKPKLKPKPQLPPRKPESLLYPPLDRTPLNNTTSSHAPSSSISSFHSVSLSSDTDTSTPGSVSNFIATFPVDLDRTPNGNKNHEADDISLTESYENVSTTSLASPATERLITLDWEKAMAKRKAVPPKLPKRPSSTKFAVKSPPPPPPYPIRRVASGSHSTSSLPAIKPTLSTTSSSSAIATSYTPRRIAPPPPPSRSSDRSSIVSTTTTYSLSSSSQSHQSHNLYSPSALSLKIKRPTPVPLAARKRYEGVFNANVIQRRKAENRKLNEKPALLSVAEARSRRAAGWRGLSVDLLTATDIPQQLDHGNNDDIVGPDEKLEGPIVRQIWKRSRLDNSRLAEIWNGCDLTGQGALGLEAFVKGMWRIDEELRRMQSQVIKAASNASLGSYRSNSHRSNTTQKSRDILR
ncbi:hypothetical protein BYT27DRAFT_7265219 [Phlegmacium glaucopus]|nr:hypothetical protein BYT27DRAFT_7265219 [Phlegmacium glaucopus]